MTRTQAKLTAIWLAALLAFSVAVAAARAQDLTADSEALIAEHGFPAAQVGYLVFDLETGAPLAGGRVDTPFIPASVAKLPTAIAALGVLGPEHRMETTVALDGAVVDGVLAGDVILRGGGDPSLDNAGLLALARQLADAGVRRIDGRFLFDAASLPDLLQINPAQPETAGYNPGVSALTLDYNRFRAIWARAEDAPGGYAVSAFARADGFDIAANWIRFEPDDDGLNAAFAVAGLDGRGDLWRFTHWLGDDGEIWLPVRQTALHTAQAFRQVAAEQGVSLPEPLPGLSPDSARVAARRASPPLRAILTATLKYSNNVAAELVGLATGRRLAGVVNGLARSGALTAQWLAERIPEADWSGFVLDNHSGLSSASRVTPAQLAAMLRYAVGDAYPGPDIDQVLAPVRWRGWLNEDRDPALPPIEVRAKSGSMGYAKGLAGYMITASGREVGFAVLISDIAAREALDAAMDLHNAATPPQARRWLAGARELERALARLWATAL